MTPKLCARTVIRDSVDGYRRFRSTRNGTTLLDERAGTVGTPFSQSLRAVDQTLTTSVPLPSKSGGTSASPSLLQLYAAMNRRPLHSPFTISASVFRAIASEASAPALNAVLSSSSRCRDLFLGLTEERTGRAPLHLVNQRPSISIARRLFLLSATRCWSVAAAIVVLTTISH